MFSVLHERGLFASKITRLTLISAQLDSLPQMVDSIRSGNPQAQLEATTAFRKLLSIGIQFQNIPLITLRLVDNYYLFLPFKLVYYFGLRYYYSHNPCQKGHIMRIGNNTD